MQGRLRKKKIAKPEAVAIDLFCGAGGLTRGLTEGGIKVVAGVDIDDDCKFPFEKNNRSATFMKSNVADLSGERLAKFYPKGSVRVLVGCAPCQPFSKYTQGLSPRRKSKWSLLDSFARIVAEIRPDILSMENVPELRRHSVFKRFVRALEKLEYHVWHSVIFSPDYGVPQNRSRLVLLASKKGKIELIKPTHKARKYPTVKSAIAHLPRLKAGMRHPKDALHCSSRLSATNMKRIRASKPGGTWRDWNPSLVAPCHTKKKGRSYPSVYGRMEWHAQSPTITTQFFGFGSGRFGHPNQDRAISLREGAILQSFPDDYAFVAGGEEYSIKKIGKLIGNAVPVKVGRAIGKSILNHVETYHGR